MTISFEGFQEIELTPKLEDHRGEVYILVFIRNNMEVPFYVGQTTRFHGRMDDYFWASFHAATDFKVGIAIQCFCGELQGRVIARHKLVSDPRAEEKALLERLKDVSLLNWERGYDYKTAEMQTVTDRIHAWCRLVAAYTAVGLEEEKA